MEECSHPIENCTLEAYVANVCTRRGFGCVYRKKNRKQKRMSRETLGCDEMRCRLVHRCMRELAMKRVVSGCGYKITWMLVTGSVCHKGHRMSVD